MARILWAAGLVLVGVAARAGIFPEDDIIHRGDSNHDGKVNISDVIHLNNFLFQGGPAPPCMNEADSNDDARVDGSDPVYLANWLYQGGSAPPWPGPANTYCVDEVNSYVGCVVGC